MTGAEKLYVVFKGSWYPFLPNFCDTFVLWWQHLGQWWFVSKCVCHCPVHWSCLNSCHKVYHWCRIPKICAVDKYVHFIVSAVFLKICWMWVLKCKKNGVTQSKIKPDVMWYVMHQSVFARPLKESSVDIVTKVKWEECVGTHPVLWG